MSAGQDHPTARELLERLGASISPDLDAYAAGELDVSQVRCVLCQVAPCVCRQCPVIVYNRYAAITGRPETEVCGMTIGAVLRGRCARGHWDGACVRCADHECPCSGGTPCDNPADHHREDVTER